MQKEKRSGVVVVMGRPNVGKSTLINSWVGSKVSIVSEKPETTRHRIAGIVNTSEAQIVFLDTPGIHESGKLLNKIMVRKAWFAVEEADVLLLLVEAGRSPSLEEKRIIEGIQRFSKPVFLLINKIDLVKRSKLLTQIDQYQALYPFKAIIPISALKRDGIPVVEKEILPCLSVGPAYYTEDQWTDQTERFLVEELIREKIFKETYEEIPYETAVRIESFQDKERVTVIEATILVEKQSQKGIVIGKKGGTLKKIGEEARNEIELLLDRKVFLQLWVKVEEGWSKKEESLKRLGLL
ncbi:MAG: GTPase Era [Deltaproteobacteria bacterium]|nr:GTPase Era [Deltaproteobacteria bacterium]